MEERVGLIDLWGCFAGKENMFMRDGFHLKVSLGSKHILFSYFIITVTFVFMIFFLSECIFSL